jgi:hypothetical protein
LGKLIKILLLYAFICTTGYAYAQSPAFYHLGTSEGLSDNNVTSCDMDKNRILWIGTTEGLYSFDGNRLTEYDKYRYPLLANNNIEGIVVDPANNVWIWTNTGHLNMLDEKRRFHLFKIGDSTDRARINHVFFIKSMGIIAIKDGRQYSVQNKTGGVFEKIVLPEADKLPATINITKKVNDDTLLFFGKNKLVL